MKLISFEGSRGVLKAAIYTSYSSFKGIYIYIGSYSVTIRLHDCVPKGLAESKRKCNAIGTLASCLGIIYFALH